MAKNLCIAALSAKAIDAEAARQPQSTDKTISRNGAMDETFPGVPKTRKIALLVASKPAWRHPPRDWRRRNA